MTPHRRSRGRRTFLVAAAVALGAQLCFAALLAVGPATAAEPTAAEPTAAELTVMSRNLYLGADVAVALTALPDVAAAAQAMWDQVAQTDFSRRAPALAGEVVAADPAVVGLQEATVWECLDQSGTAVPVFDFTAQFLDALRRAGADYVVAAAGGASAVSPGFGIAPISGGSVVTDPVNLPPLVGATSAACGFTVSDVLLVRADQADQVTAVGHTTYAERVALVPGVVEIQRGYTWADLTAGATSVRVVTTHLEASLSAESGPAAATQARQLVADLSTVAGPLVVLGDFNSDPRDPRPLDEVNSAGQPVQSVSCPDRSCSAYWTMVGGGFTDAGPDATDPANFTWGADAILAGPSPERLPAARAEGNPYGFTDRLDYVFTRGDVSVVSAEVIGQHWPDGPSVWDCPDPAQVEITRRDAAIMGIPAPSTGRCFSTDHAGLRVALDVAQPVPANPEDSTSSLWWVLAFAIGAVIVVGGIVIVVRRR